MVRLIFIFTLLAIVQQSNAQTRSYLSMFAPNSDTYGEVMKKSPQKTMVEINCDFTNGVGIGINTPDEEEQEEPENDSMDCLGDVFVYNNAGRLTNHYESRFQTQTVFTYDAKSRVIGYVLKEWQSGTVMDDITIVYEKSGKIASITNAAKGEESITVSYYPAEEKMIVSQSTYIDELYFKNGRIVTEVNKNNQGQEYYRGNYTYDNKGRIVKKEGTLNENLLDLAFTEEITYDATSLISTNYKVFDPENTSALIKTRETKYIYKNKNLERQETTYIEYGFPGDPIEPLHTSVLFTYDDMGRTTRAEYFDADYFLLSVRYLYK